MDDLPPKTCDLDALVTHARLVSAGLEWDDSALVWTHEFEAVE